uniref:Uncharacterized protein n=1 Tax=Arundo donax TaxID=35708 RepID=A0A0A8ZF91_ARUDO
MLELDFCVLPAEAPALLTPSINLSATRALMSSKGKAPQSFE